MDYLSVDEAKELGGLRLVLTGGVPGPWSEAAKAIFNARSVDYQPVLQVGGRANPELVSWTLHRNAPIALYNNEPPRVRWLELLDLAERLGSGASLFPEDIEQRIFMVGLVNEIAGENGMAWNARTLMLHAGFLAQGDVVLQKNPMYAEYQYNPEIIALAKTRVESFLQFFAKHIHAQVTSGSDYLVGDSFTAADIYWACFSNMLESLPPEKNPMPEGLRKSWAVLGQSIDGYDKVLIEQRDKIFEKHLVLPLSF